MPTAPEGRCWTPSLNRDRAWNWGSIRAMHSFDVLLFNGIPGDAGDEVRSWLRATVLPLVLNRLAQQASERY